MTTTSQRVTRAVATSVILGAVIPFVVYEIASPKLGELGALLLGGLVPGLVEVASVVRHERLDPMSTVSLVALLLGVALAFGSGSPRALLVRESAVTGAVGVAFLVSLLAPKPGIYYLARQFTTGDVREDAAAFDARWESSPPMRAVLVRITLLWGIGLVAEFGARLVIIFTLPTERVLVVGPVVFYATLALLIAATVRQTRRARKARDAAATRRAG